MMQKMTKENSNLSKDVYIHLKDKIYQGDLSPGSLIHVDNVAKNLGLSHSPVKEALINLEHEGFIDILPRRGARVRTPNQMELQGYYDSIGLFESHIVIANYQNICSSLLTQLEIINADLQAAFKNNDCSGFHKIDSYFHEQLVNISDNKFLTHRLRSLRTLIFSQACFQYNSMVGQQHVEEHIQLLTYLKESQTQMAADFLQKVHWSGETR